MYETGLACTIHKQKTLATRNKTDREASQYNESAREEFGS